MSKSKLMDTSLDEEAWRSRIRSPSRHIFICNTVQNSDKSSSYETLQFTFHNQTLKFQPAENWSVSYLHVFHVLLLGPNDWSGADMSEPANGFFSCGYYDIKRSYQ